MRATSAALNAIGLGLGPLTTGILSDQLAPLFGDDSLRYSLLIVGAIVGPWAATHYYLAGRHIDGDLLRAGEAD